MGIITNPTFLAVLVMVGLCLLKVNVYIAIIAAALFCGLLGGAQLPDIIALVQDGMNGQGENAIVFIILATIASAIVSSGMGDALAPRVSKAVGKRPWILMVGLILIAICGETVITFGATFCFIILPPLLSVFNKYSIDRRKIATAIMCGLQIGYVCVPIGYGAVFQGIVATAMEDNGVTGVSYLDVAAAAWPVAIAMVVAAVMVSVLFRKPRTYTPVPGITAPAEGTDPAESDVMPPWKLKYTLSIVAALATPIVQILTGSIVLGSLVALILICLFRVADLKKLDEHVFTGMKNVGVVVFVMAVGSGFANVAKTYGDVEGLVNSAVSLLGNSKPIAAVIMLLLGLIVTIGIGSSWGTVPIVAVIMVPMGLQLGFSIPAILLLICGAAVLGDAGSPASDQTLVPSANLNLDGQHDHIWDTCVPSFLCCNIPIIILCAIFACIF